MISYTRQEAHVFWIERRATTIAVLCLSAGSFYLLISTLVFREAVTTLQTVEDCVLWGTPEQIGHYLLSLRRIYLAFQGASPLFRSAMLWDGCGFAAILLGIAIASRTRESLSSSLKMVPRAAIPARRLVFGLLFYCWSFAAVALCIARVVMVTHSPLWFCYHGIECAVAPGSMGLAAIIATRTFLLSPQRER